MGNVFIYAAAEGIAQTAPCKDDIAIFCDGGIKYAIHGKDAGKKLVMGDFDSSLRDNVPEDCEIFVYPVRKNKTDLELALDKATEFNPERVFVYGACGGERPDQYFANVMLMAYAAGLNLNCVMSDGEYSYFALKESEARIACETAPVYYFAEKEEQGTAENRKHLSVYALTDSIITLKGVDYEADRIALKPGITLGVSNAIIKDALIRADKGTILIIGRFPPDRIRLC